MANSNPDTSPIPNPTTEDSIDSDSDTDLPPNWKDPDAAYPWSDEEEEQIPPTKEQWEPTLRALTSSFSSISPSSPSESPNSFRLRAHSLLTQTISEVQTNGSIPRFLTDPPCKKFKILFFDTDPKVLSGQEKLSCPCCLPISESNITLSNDDGITKEQLITAVREYLYGEEWTEEKDGPKVWKGDELVQRWENKEEGMMRVRKGVVCKYNWLGGGWIDKEDRSKGRKCLEPLGPEVVLFVCGVDEFERLVKGVEKDGGGEVV
ncbi:hypothetical protein QBC38DRAFT_218386 [Podospora fimiseda]|uniref:Uncharacterized protein n=1 Tax=Podospora fimiseda TaxID=252190 RepID=A0AAN7GXP4_9PEZI|nr:hypothetical protein QBC38DRAFT_218386 [Podospora fimiseda]